MDDILGNIEPEPLSDSSWLPDISADDDLMKLVSKLLSTEGEPKKSIEQWLVEQLGPIVEANTARPPPGTSPPTDIAILFPKTFSGLIAGRALAAYMSEMSLVGSSTGDSSDVRAQGVEKDSIKNQSRCGMKYNVTCKQCGEKKTKCVCPTKIDAGVTADPHSVRFDLKTERCIVVKEPGGKSDRDKRRETAN